MEPAGVSIQRERLHDKVVRELALGILRGTIGPGESALSTEGDLCRHFDVSRTILREAVKVLAAKGMIELRPRTGIVVRARNKWNLVDPDLLGWICEAGVDDVFVRDLFEVRATVEPAAAELAAARASDSEIEELLRWYARIEANTGNEPARLEADRKFHATIFVACHNVFLTQMNATVGAALWATQQIGVHLPQAMKESLLAHREVASAIARRDSAAACDAMDRLIAQSTRHIYQVLHPNHG